VTCDRCDAPAATWIRYSGAHLCREHFMAFVERRVKEEIRREVDLRPGIRIAIGLSGGKDSSTATTLLHDIASLRRDVELVGITVDEGIASYRPQGLEAARSLCVSLGIEHRVITYRQTVGFEMDRVVTLDADAIPCGYCGVFRRQALNRAAREVDADYVATGLNLDDTAQSILMNISRGDVDKLARLGPHEHEVRDVRAGDREHRAIIQGAEGQVNRRDAEKKTEITDAVDEERLELGMGGRIAGKPETDQQVGHQAHCFPAEEEQQEIVRHHQHQH